MTEAASAPLPRLSTASSIDNTPEGWIGVNPSGKAYALGPALAAYANALLDARTLGDLHTRLRKTTGTQWTDADLTVANSQLSKLGFLEENKGARESRKRRVHYVPPLTVQLTLTNPERLFRSLERGLRRINTRVALALATLAVLGGAISVFFNREMVISSLAQPLALTEYLLLLVMMTAATALHEAGHAAALARLGGRPKRVGVMLFYLMPAFFCDVSDAWRVGNRRQRALVALSGVLVQVTLAGLAEIAAAVLPGDQLISRVLAAFGILSFLAALVNTIPFVKFDGYIALMALVGHNFLRRDAINEGRRLLARTFITLKVQYQFPEARWIRWYGLGCILFPAYLIAAAMWLWLSQLKALGTAGGIAALAAVAIFAMAVVRELVMIARTATSAGGRPSKVWGVGVTLAALVGAALLLVQVPITTVAGYITENDGVKLVLPAGTFPSDLAPQAEIRLRSNGMFLHQGGVHARLPENAAFQEQNVPLSAIAPVETSLLEFRGQTVSLDLEVPTSEPRELPSSGQAIVYGPDQPLWQAAWRAFF